MRAIAESFWSTVRGHARIETRDDPYVADGYMNAAALSDRPDVAEEIREAKTGHFTPRRFWRCDACGREGHEF